MVAGRYKRVKLQSFQYRLVEHATRQSLAAGFALHPDVIYFSGFADGDGWYLEGETMEAEKAPWPWLLEQIAKGATRALHTVILNDSLGYLSPVTAYSRANDLLETGLPGLVRIRPNGAEHAAGGVPPPVTRGETSPLKMMGVSAHPLTESPETHLGRIQHPLGSRFISEEYKQTEMKQRLKLSDERQSLTHKFAVGGHEGYITVGLYENGKPSPLRHGPVLRGGCLHWCGVQAGGGYGRGTHLRLPNLLEKQIPGREDRKA